MRLPGNVPTHELVMSAALGAVMGLVGFYVVRAIGPAVEQLVNRAG